MRNLNQETITQAVIARLAQTPDVRLKELMTSLVQHLHAFARETRLTESEWQMGIDFLTSVGQKCSPLRQEFIALSDVLGLSTLARGAPGQACLVRGRVCAPDGSAVAGAEVEVWQSDDDGRDDVQSEGLDDRRARGELCSGSDGCFEFRTVLALPYQVPDDGPVGHLLRATGGHPWRPAHMHFRISAPGYEPLTTHAYREGSPYPNGGAVYGVRQSPIAPWVHDGQGGHRIDFEFVLRRRTM